MVSDRNAQLAYENRTEPDPDSHNWRECAPEPLEGEELWNEVMEILKEGRYER